MSKQVIITNTVHNSYVTLRLESLGEGRYRMTPRQFKRYRNELCGLRDCKCLGNTGNLRPHHRILPLSDGSFELSAYE